MQPSFLFITCHDLGRHLGCYGIRSVHTPTLDRLAGEGVRFARSFCTSPGCSPSRAALATGRYPHSNGVLGLAHAHFGWDLSPGEQHVAALLSRAGYHTALFGLQHVTYDVERLGFRTLHPARPGDAVAANLQAFVQSWGARPEPFYFEVNFFEPHRPFDFGAVGPDESQGVQVPGYLPEGPGTRSELALMQGAIRKVDECVARMEAALRDAGLLERTIVVFTADHGIAFPRAKGTLYDPGLEIALLARGPGIRGRRVLEPLVSNVDLLPTVLGLAGVNVPGNVQGHTVAPLLRVEPGYTARTAVYAEKTFHNEYDPLRCIRTSAHKLIARFEASNPVEVPADIMRGASYPEMLERTLSPRGTNFELYDLVADPWEQQNLEGQPETAELQRELTYRLAEWMRETGDPLLRGPVASPFYHRTLNALQHGTGRA